MCGHGGCDELKGVHTNRATAVSRQETELHAVAVVGGRRVEANADADRTPADRFAGDSSRARRHRRFRRVDRAGASAPRRVARPRAGRLAGAPAARPARCRYSAPIRPSTGRRAARGSGPSIGAGGAGDATGATSTAASARGGDAGAADPESAGADANLERGGVEGCRARPQWGSVERGCDERDPIDRRVSNGRAARARHREPGKIGRRVPNS